jgi:hypothetical protein
MSTWAACTIAAKARLPSARVVAASFAEHHPGVPFFVLLADEVEGCFDPAAEAFELLGLDDLDLPDLRARCFRYEREQLSYALTPTVLRHVLGLGFERALFLKQESLVCGPLDAAVERLEHAAILLTPHLLEPLDNDRELNILMSGVYNLGFLGVADRPAAHAFLEWWEERLATDCRHAVEEGLHWEQRWADLLPSLFDDVGVLRDERFNVGHWNLPERSVEDCRLFRFSGYEPDAPEQATRYADRLITSALDGASEHFARYREALLAAGWDEARDWPYAFDRFADGAPIPPLARAFHDELGGERFADPFAVGAGSFAAWLCEPVDERWPSVSRFWLELHGRRDDLRDAYPDPLGTDRREFARWTRETGPREHAIPATLDLRARRRGTRAVVTIVGRNRLPAARVLAESLREHQPGMELHVVLADEPCGLPAAGDEPCVLHGMSELDLRDPIELGLRSAPLALCVRLKPCALEALLDEGYSAALFLDPDQWVLGDLEPLWAAVECNAIVLTPHLVAPPTGADAAARERMLLRAGTHNAGTIGVSEHPEARRMLAWWGERLDAANHGRVDEGAYYDQRWLDLVPSLFDGVHVMRDARFNVGHWNLPERGDVDVRLLHASGFDPLLPQRVTRHDPRLDGVETGCVASLLERYAQALLGAGQDEAGRLPWGWSRFADGTRVPSVAGDLLAALGANGARFRGDPLAAGPGSFRAWLATPADEGRPPITHLWAGVHALRADLRDAFPDPLGADRTAFARWIEADGAREHDVDERLMPAAAPPPKARRRGLRARAMIVLSRAARPVSGR